MVRNWLPLRSSKSGSGDSNAQDASSITPPGSIGASSASISTAATVTEDGWTGSQVSKDSEWSSIHTPATTLREANDSADDVALSIHPLATKDGLIAKITPPAQPSKPIAHVPCDIVLVIDVSGSMGSNAPIPANPGEQAENYGLSVLDLVKHASKTILETLNDGDRLGIVTFASRAKVVQKLIPMNEKNKKTTNNNIESMHPTDATNLWHGLLQGVKLFEEGGEVNTGRVPAIFLLTDGQPNHMCPVQGYVPKIRSMEKFPASVHTFGFGYSLRSGLLKSIAEIGGGNYAFIPDAGMIGTVFVHAVANLQTTYAIEAVLRLTYPSALELELTTGRSVEQQKPVTLEDEPGEPTQLTIPLGNIQYGQTRDIYLRVKGLQNKKLESPTIFANLKYSRMTSVPYMKRSEQSLTATTSLPESEIAYHISRSEICEFLAGIIPVRGDDEHQALSEISKSRIDLLNRMISGLPAQRYPDEPKNKSLLEDLSGPEPKGQISMAMTNPTYYAKWGVHYLPSVLNAHTRQICNTFKDSGPLQYGVDSPLFIACRNKLDHAFDNIPAPKPSNQRMATHRGHFSMSSYNKSSGVCFAASTPVTLASGTKIPISSLRKGVSVSTPSGSRRVAVVLKTPVVNESMCRIGQLVVTPWHPISMDGGNDWIFPDDIASNAVRYTGCIYSILLQPDKDSASHAIQVTDGIWGVTLGHGILSGDDVRAHGFFGNYSKVLASLKKISIDKTRGIAIGGGVCRSSQTGLADGFKGGRRTIVARKRLRAVSSRLPSLVVVKPVI